MKRILMMLAVAMAMLAVGTACDDKPVEVPEVEKFLEVSPATINAKDVAGEYTFTWTYATNTLTITFPAKSTVGFENIEATENAVKFIENGKLYIIREGNVYDATGARVK